MDAHLDQFLCSSGCLLQVCTLMFIFLVHAFYFCRYSFLVRMANNGYDNLAVYFNLLADARLTIYGFKKIIEPLYLRLL